MDNPENGHAKLTKRLVFEPQQRRGSLPVNLPRMGAINRPLVRKHSSGDLHSRLKTRKLLGVGETDDGDVHRSKLSQILGHSEQLYVKLPKGLRIWQLANALMFSVIGAWALIFPLNLFSFAVTSQTDPIVILPIRLYGTALLTLAVMFWSTLWSLDRDTIRWSLRASILYFAVQFIVWSLSWFSVSHPGVAIGFLDVLLSIPGALMLVGPLACSVPALLFYPSIGTKHNW